ncbi:hypothetical protein OG233_10175 [Streptomyces sp. NBC_01218]|uniref:hypothetical protein n=1 Tax=unclassified Streptomyces TaxID=2593676 RepID=UPI0023B8C624|nr:MULTISPECIES: hypothetical protein [unclassified Streptomyces]WEH39824.1 hypothetical protein PZB77_10005 [Streptomyces sp. AM 2-1-1]WSQ51516.1 hypothetical protein OG233_10175 [Streptomyces sp. NBC_01218]
MTSSAPAVRARRRTALALALGAGLALGLTGCSGEDPDAGTNGLGKLPATEIDTRARAAADAAGAVHLAGTLISKDGSYTLDMRLNADGGTGSVTSEESTFAVLRVGDDLYLKADAAFWSAEQDGKGEDDDAEAAKKLDGKYVKVPEDDPTYKRLRGFTEKDTLLDGLLTLHGTVNKGDRDTITGVPTIQILGGKGEGGTLDVALRGEPYPVRVARGGGGGTVTLADWGRSFDLAAPPREETVDYGGELPRSSG